MKKIGIGLLALAAAILVALATGSPGAFAATEEPEPVCGTWQASIFVGAAGPASAPSAVEVNAAGTTATLKRPAADTGVEYLRKGLDLEGPLTISVAVDASESEAASGAVRIFGYASKTPNTMTDAPDYGAPKPEDAGAVATGPGTLTLTLGSGEKLGTLGFTWDSSNPNYGEVTFGPATVGDRPVSFKACPEPEQTASPSPTAAPTTNAPTTGPTRGPRTTASPSTLPVTGSGGGLNPLVILLPIGAVLVLGGTGAILMARRRRFTAE